MIGQDSFLDVVTNIVGILILLVMVVGMRTSHAAKREVSEPSAANSAMRKQRQEHLTEAYQDVAIAEQGLRELLCRAANTRDEARLREQERALLSTMVAEAEQKIAARRRNLNAQDQRDFDMRRKRAEAQLTLDELTRQHVALVSQETIVEEVACQPTPLARIVTGDETHILLADDHVAVVPFKELFELLREDAPKNFWRLKRDEVLERTIGPIGGFRVRYWFVLSDATVRESGSVISGKFNEFQGCDFLPVTTPIGEPALEALHHGSEFQQHLQQLNPHRTTVTIWTYPGNYDRLRELKRVVREQGFQVALRTLPPGMPIGASPTGSKSAAE
jgi:hypothetical protein